MKKYIIRSNKFYGELVLGYIDGKLVFFDISTVSNNAAMLVWIYENLPSTIAHLQAWPSKTKNSLVITEVPMLLTFDAFWKAYNYKVGSKIKTASLWNKLSEEKRTLALAKIEKYRQWTKGKGIDMVYPERYIKDERFENDF